MRTLQVKNVCCALPAGVSLLIRHGMKEESRNGTVLVMPHPVVTVTERPRERVLFSPVRNANPFFHLFEAIWMLAGRDDAAPLNAFIKGFGTRYGEEDGTIHGAYGRRWRSAFGLDQINVIVEKLCVDPTTRQAVIQMWDCYGCSDLDGNWRDRPCNTHIYLRIRNGQLDLTVCCRSNDAIWGAHGANAVHFSILQEYLATRIGVEVGKMFQFSNNYHAYLSELQKFTVAAVLMDDRYEGVIMPKPMFDKPEAIDLDILQFMECYEERSFPQLNFANKWFNDTLGMMMMAHHHFKMGNKSQALWYADQIVAPDWRIACKEWLERYT